MKIILTISILFIVSLFSTLNLSYARLVAQTQFVTWNLARISHRAVGRPTYIYDDRAGEGITVYVLDTGVDIHHEEFWSKRASNPKNYVYKEPNEDLNGHGTAIAGIIAGRKFGIAKKARIVSVKVANQYGRPLVGDMIAGIIYSINQANKLRQKAIINVGFTRLPAQGLHEAINRAIEANIPVIVPAGDANEDACLFGPSNVKGAIVVASSDKSDRAMASNYGPCVDIYAPGVDIRTAYIGIDVHNRTYQGYGSSFAAAHVTGVAAVLLSVNKNLSTDKLYEKLVNISNVNFVHGVDGQTPNRLLFNRQAPRFAN